MFFLVPQIKHMVGSILVLMYEGKHFISQLNKVTKLLHLIKFERPTSNKDHI